jgi:hypothetical protein
MTRNLKIAMFVLASGALTLASGGCGLRTFMQFLGDIAGDSLFLRGID